MPNSKPRRGKFLKVTATIELDDGSRFQFLNLPVISLPISSKRASAARHQRND